MRTGSARIDEEQSSTTRQVERGGVVKNNNHNNMTEKTKQADEQAGDETLAAQVAEYMGSKGGEEIAAAYLALGITASSDPEEIAGEIDEAYSGKFTSDEEFAQDIAEQLGSIDKNAAWPQTCIDWEWAARELMMDYSEEGGHYFRNV